MRTMSADSDFRMVPAVRRAGPGDYKGIVALYPYLAAPDSEISASPPPPPGVWEEIMTHPDFFAYFLAEKGGVPVATANVAIIPNLTHGGRPFAIVENVVSHPDVRGEGFGRAVMKAIEDYARERGCYKIQLQSTSTRLDAHRFYESLGYSRTAKVGFTLVLE